MRFFLVVADIVLGIVMVFGRKVSGGDCERASGSRSRCKCIVVPYNIEKILIDISHIDANDGCVHVRLASSPKRYASEPLLSSRRSCPCQVQLEELHGVTHTY